MMTPSAVKKGEADYTAELVWGIILFAIEGRGLDA